MDSDPNDDPEFVSLFTISTEEDLDSDDDLTIANWGSMLQPSDTPYDRATRVQQANRELFSQPVVKKKANTRVQFDLIPQNGEESNEEGGEGEGSRLNSHLSDSDGQSTRKLTKALLVPRLTHIIREQPGNNVKLDNPTREIVSVSLSNTDDTLSHPNEDTQSYIENGNLENPQNRAPRQE